MAKKSWFDSWCVSGDFLEKALQQLDEDGTDMSRVFIVPATKREHTDYRIVYKTVLKNCGE